MSDARDLLRRLAAHHEPSLRTALRPTPEFERGAGGAEEALDGTTRVLVRLAALIVLDASTESLRWAVEQALTSGADDEALAAVLVTTGPANGSAQLVASAPQLVAALGFELHPGSRADLLLTEKTRVERAGHRL